MRWLVFTATLFLVPSAVLAGVTYTPKQLYAMVTSGIPVLERRDDGNILHVRRKQLTDKQKRHIEKLGQLGYVDGTASAAERCALAITHDGGAVNKLSVHLPTFAGDSCSLRVILSDAKGKVVYSKTVTPKDAGAGKKDESGVLVFDVGKEKPGANVKKIRLRFDGCNVAIAKIEAE